jgi:hypothetical protein
VAEVNQREHVAAARERWRLEQGRAAAEGRPPDPRLHPWAEEYWARLFPEPDYVPRVIEIAIAMMVIAGVGAVIGVSIVRW